jgi:hypothetical protein
MESACRFSKKECVWFGVFGHRRCSDGSENVVSYEISSDTEDVENVVPGERVVASFDFDNREDGR